MGSIIAEFSQFLVGLDSREIPEDIMALAKERVLDSAGAIAAGMQEWTLRDRFFGACREMGADPGGGGSAGAAAMLYGTLGAAAELDDGHRNAGAHAGAVALAAVLSVCAEARCSGREALAAIVLCYEIIYRLAVHTGGLIKKGFHPTSALGSIGAAAAAARLYRLSEEQTADALGLAAMFASGMMEVVHASPDAKGVLVGKAVMNGVQAAQMAKWGIPGPHSALEGKAGLFQLFAPDTDQAALTQGLGQSYCIGDTYTKLYPACRHTHAAIEAAAELVRRHGIRPEDIANIEVGTYQVACDLTGVTRSPRDTGEAKFSMAYCVAVGIREGAVGLMHLKEPYLSDPELLSLCEKVSVAVDPAMQAQYPDRRGARVGIALSGGQTVEETCYELKGSPEKPVSWDEIVDKVKANGTPALTTEQCEGLATAAAALEEGDNLTTTMKILHDAVFNNGNK